MSCRALLSLFVLLLASIAFAQEEFTVVVEDIQNTFYDDHPSLLRLSYVWEFCTTGVWVMYSSQNYLNATRIFPTTERECVNLQGYHSVRSIRFVGLRYNISAPSVTLFSDRGLSGASVTFVYELPYITSPVNSLVTIGTNVELFEDFNFKGSSTCLYIKPDYCNNGVCWDWELDVSGITWDINSAKSAKVGCEPTTVLTQFSPKNRDARILF